jgi:dihydropteroate synthase
MGGSLASAVIGVQQGVEIIRAHDVRETFQALETTKVLARS